MLTTKSPEWAVQRYLQTCITAGTSAGPRPKSATVHRFPLARRRAQVSPPVAQRRGVVVTLHTNTYDQAIVALVLMKNEEQAYVDMVRDDRTISALMKLTHAATAKVIEAHLRGHYGYPSEHTLATILQMLEETGVFGPG
jgi:hypothetical protein